MNSTAQGVYIIILALTCISIAQLIRPSEWVRLRLVAFKSWYMNPDNPEPVWIFFIMIIAMIAYIGGWVVEI